MIRSSEKHKTAKKKLIKMRDKHDAALAPNSPIVVPEMVLAWSGIKTSTRASILKGD